MKIYQVIEIIEDEVRQNESYINITNFLNDKKAEDFFKSQLEQVVDEDEYWIGNELCPDFLKEKY